MRNNKQVLVTGGAGFIGSNLVDTLMNLGNNVVVLDNLSTGSKANIEKWLRSKNFSFIEGDLLNKEDVEKAVHNCDTVFHLAANPDVKIGFTDTRIDYEQNVFATYILLETMRNNACKKLIFTSSSTVYGEPNIISIYAVLLITDRPIGS